MSDSTDSGIIYLEDSDPLAILSQYGQSLATYLDRRTPGHDVYSIDYLTDDIEYDDNIGFAILDFNQNSDFYNVSRSGGEYEILVPGVYLINITIGILTPGDSSRQPITAALAVNWQGNDIDQAFNCQQMIGSHGGSIEFSAVFPLKMGDHVGLYIAAFGGGTMTVQGLGASNSTHTRASIVALGGLPEDV